jgi:LacI family transcriptional regulator
VTAMAAHPDHPAHAYFKERYQRVRQLLESNFRERSETGTLRAGVDPGLAAALWLAVQDGLALQWLLDETFDPHQAVGEFIRLVVVPETASTQTREDLRVETVATPDLGTGPGLVASSLAEATPRDLRPEPKVRRPDHGPVRRVRRATIQDVAREAGVSVSAVSKVVRDAYGVSPQMRATVTEAIEQLGYRPHAGARTMRGRSFTVGVMIPELSSPFLAQVADVIARELEHTPFQEVLVPAGAAAARQQHSIEALIDRQVDGLILVAPWMRQAWLETIGARLPTVVVARHGGADNFDTVVDDDFEGARLMVNHLVGLGHRRIVHTSQPSGGLERPHVLSHTARSDGYIHTMKAHGLSPEVIVTAYSELGGYDAAVEALARPHPPTAIFAGADIAALGVLRAAELRGLNVPEALTVVGYDNIYTSSIGRVSLTTVDQSAHLTGLTAATLLMERLDGRTEPVHHVVAPSVVPRDTSASPPREPETETELVGRS